MSRPQSSHPPDELRHSIAQLVAIVVIFLVIWLGVVTWPMWPLLLISLGAWAMAKWKRSLWAETSEDVLLYVSIGLALLCGILALLNAGTFVISEQHIRDGETELVRAHLFVEEWRQKLESPASIAVFVLVLALTWALPRVGWVKHHRTLTTSARRLAIVLTTMTSFTLFAQKPLQDLAADVHVKLVQRYEMALREEEKAIGQFLAAEEINQSLPTLDEAGRNSLKTVFNAIQNASIGSPFGRYDSRRYIAQRVAQEDSSQGIALSGLREFLASKVGVLPDKADTHVADAIRPPPNSRRDLDLQTAVVVQEEQRATRATALKGAMLALCKDSLGKMLGLLTPGARGIEGVYVDTVVDTVSDAGFSDVGKKYRQGSLLDFDLYRLGRELLPPAGFISKLFSGPNRNSSGVEIMDADSVRAFNESRIKNIVDDEVAHENELRDVLVKIRDTRPFDPDIHAPIPDRFEPRPEVRIP